MCIRDRDIHRVYFHDIVWLVNTVVVGMVDVCMTELSVSYMMASSVVAVAVAVVLLDMALISGTVLTIVSIVDDEFGDNVFARSGHEA